MEGEGRWGKRTTTEFRNLGDITAIAVVAFAGERTAQADTIVIPVEPPPQLHHYRLRNRRGSSGCRQ